MTIPWRVRRTLSLFSAPVMHPSIYPDSVRNLYVNPDAAETAVGDNQRSWVTWM
jgi:hypothetical protein